MSTLFATTSHVAECPDLGPECATATPPVPFRHHVDLFLTDVSVDASYGVRPWLAAEVRLALRIVDITPTYTELDGRPKEVPNDIHHRDQTLVGPTDPWLVLRVGGKEGCVVAGARLGITLPIGSTEPDPYALGAEGKSHEHTQFGTGTFLPIVGGGLSCALAPVDLSVSALGLFSFAENAHAFRAPSRFFAGAQAGYALGALRPYVSLDLSHETEELWHGGPGLEGSSVRTELLMGAGASWAFAPPWRAEVGVRVRAAQLTSGASFDYPGILQLGLATSFDLGGGSARAAPEERGPHRPRQRAHGVEASGSDGRR
jgi:hypothetical protein